MIQLITQYSIFIAVPGFLIAMIALLPIRSWQKRIPIYSAAGIIAIVVVLALQPGDSNVATESEAKSVIASGQPVFLEFFSNTCVICLASEPIVKSLKGEAGSEVQFLRLNVEDPIASQLIRDYRAYATPTFVVIGSDGEEVWRQSGKILNKGAAMEALEAA